VKPTRKARRGERQSPEFGVCKTAARQPGELINGTDDVHYRDAWRMARRSRSRR